jgi:drug/metabolite transporter (DMT)-like permease
MALATLSKEDRKNFFILHVVVFIWGWTGILGKLIAMPVLPMIWVRMIATVAMLWLFGVIVKKNFLLQKKEIVQLFSTGFLIALHWIFFYQTIKISTVSIAVICLSTSTFFNSILTSIIDKTKPKFYELGISLIVMLAIAYIFNYQPGYELGMIFGVISAFFSAAFTTVNGRISKNFDAIVFSVYELLGGVILLSILLFFFPANFIQLIGASASDWWYLFILSSLCTAIPFVASAYVLKHIPSFSVLLAINLEPVYTIILAYLIFGEQEKMNLPFYVGTMVILLTLFGNAWVKNRNRK